MRHIDELHLEHPFMGARMLRDQLNRQGFVVGRKHVSTLMKHMGVEALYEKPNTSKKHPGHKICPGEGINFFGHDPLTMISFL